MTPINGNGDVVSTIEEVLKRAKEGEITGVVIATIAGTQLGSGWAIHDDEPFGWARLLVAAANLQHELLVSDIDGDEA